MVAQLVQRSAGGAAAEQQWTQVPAQSLSPGVAPDLRIVVPCDSPELVKERHPATFENIAYGLHRCDEAQMHFTTGMLKELDACSERFSRLAAWGRYSDDKHITISHATLDRHEYRGREDITWLLEAIDTKGHRIFEDDESQQTLERLALLQLNIDGLGVESSTVFDTLVCAEATPYVAAKAPTVVWPHPHGNYGEYWVDPNIWLSGDARTRMTSYRINERDRRVLAFGHAMIELAHHDFLDFTMNEEDCECESESPVLQLDEIQVSMAIICGCGYEDDDFEVTLGRRTSYAWWTCYECKHEHHVELPTVNW